MAERSFYMRQRGRYRDAENTVEDLQVEHLDDGQWQAFDLDIHTPGFLIYVYALLSCQHLYLRANAAERGIELGSAEGTIELTASEDWEIQTVRVHFDVNLRSGTPGPGDVDYIVGRMKSCPVSKNIQGLALKETSVSLRGSDTG